MVYDSGMELIHLGSITQASVNEVLRARTAEADAGFPQLVVLPDGTSPPAYGPPHMYIETGRVLLTAEDMQRRFGDPPVPSYSLVELPRKVIGLPNEPITYVFDRE